VSNQDSAEADTRPLPVVFIASGDVNWTEAVLDTLSGCRCLTAADCRELLERIEGRQPDLLVLDARLEGATELCRSLKSSPATGASAVMIWGGAGSDDVARHRAIDAGADHWLPGPELPREELRSRALHLLRWRGEVRSLISANDHLRRRNDWVRYLVHDLRNPLTVISANVSYFAETLQQRGERGFDDALRETSFQLQRMNAMLRDMLDIDRVQRGELVLARVRIDLREFADRAAGDVRLLAGGKGVAITVEGESGLEIDADPSLIERLIANLVSNAMRYARKLIRVLIGREGGRAILQVINDGRRVTPELEERIFLPFVQGDGGLGGAGLGLAFCRLVATQHGGSMRLRTNVDGAVSFELGLVAAPAARV
jgi:signal transduction histidine kinase